MTIESAARVFERILSEKGLHEALRFLNQRTPHRFTGVYRYDGDVLRNEHLFDLNAPEVTRGPDVPMVDAYCDMVRRTDEPIEFLDVRRDGTIAPKEGSPVVSYCGVLIRDEEGQPYGTLCHYDVKRCEERSSDMPLLEAVAPLVYRALGAAV